MIKRERIYIFPTLYGFMYGAGCLFSLLCGLLYANNLAYLLCFFLLAVFVIGMHQSNNNLRKLQFEKIDGDLFSAKTGGTATLWLKSQNPDGHIRLNIEGQASSTHVSSRIELLPRKSLFASPLYFAPTKRGQEKLRRIKISSRYPFGLFYVWRYFTLSHSFFVYPSPFGDKPLPTAEADQNVPAKARNGKGDDFQGHRAYVTGESQKRMDWKASARSQAMLIKEFDVGNNGQIHLPWDDTHQTEKDLEQMSQWVLICASQDQHYSMQCLETHLPAGRGAAHRDQALKILSLAELP